MTENETLTRLAVMVKDARAMNRRTIPIDLIVDLLIEAQLPPAREAAQ